MENLTYEEFIQNILDTRGRFNCGDEYHERHHIIPKCMDGSNNDDNLIDLFAREHFIAHKLLALENPENNSLVYAWWCMANAKDKNQKRYELSPEEYEEARKRIVENNKRENLPDDVHQKMIKSAKQRFSIPENNPMYGKHHSEETKEKIRQKNVGKQSGENNPFYGKKHTEETRKQMSESGKGKHTRENLSEDTLKKMSDNAKARTGSLNYISKAVVRLYDLKIYECMSDAAKDNNVSRTTIRRWCGKMIDWMYLKDWEVTDEL